MEMRRDETRTEFDGYRHAFSEPRLTHQGQHIGRTLCTEGTVDNVRDHWQNTATKIQNRHVREVIRGCIGKVRETGVQIVVCKVGKRPALGKHRVIVSSCMG